MICKLKKPFTYNGDQVPPLVHGTSIQELEQVLACAPEKAKNLLAKLLNPNGFRQALYRAMFFVGEPGVGKTSLAKAIAYVVHKVSGWSFRFYSSSDFGSSNDQRNSAAHRMLEVLNNLAARDNQKIIVIIDEIGRLLENHASAHHDTGYTATALWTFLDKIKNNNNFFLMGTLNEAHTIPEPFKERIQQSSIVLPKPTPEMRRKIFCSKLIDPVIQLDAMCNNNFFDALLMLVPGWSGRSLEAIIDEAVEIAREADRGSQKQVLLKPVHFEQALAMLMHMRDDVFKIGHQLETEAERQERLVNKQLDVQQTLHKESLENQNAHAAQQTLTQIALARAQEGTVQMCTGVVNATGNIVSEDALSEARNLIPVHHMQAYNNQKAASSNQVQNNTQGAVSSNQVASPQNNNNQASIQTAQVGQNNGNLHNDSGLPVDKIIKSVGTLAKATSVLIVLTPVAVATFGLPFVVGIAGTGLFMGVKFAKNTKK